MNIQRACIHTCENKTASLDSRRKHLQLSPISRALLQNHGDHVTRVPEKKVTITKGAMGLHRLPGFFLSLEIQLRYNSLTEFTRKWSHTKGMREYILAVPGSSCTRCPLCPRLSSANTFLPPYLFCWRQCELGSAVQTHSKSWLSTLVHSHVLPPFWWLLEGRTTTLEA